MNTFRLLVVRRKFLVRNCRRLVLAGAVLAGMLGAFAPTPAQAQYGSYFFYRNPRTGMTYSQSVGVGPGSAYGGFSYSRGGRSYSAGSGYSGRCYYSGMGYASPNFQYGQQSWYGR